MTVAKVEGCREEAGSCLWLPAAPLMHSPLPWVRLLVPVLREMPMDGVYLTVLSTMADRESLSLPCQLWSLWSAPGTLPTPYISPVWAADL